MYNKGDKSEFQHGDELTYTCSRGYKSPMEDPMTFPSITCEAGVWQGDTPTCDGKVIIQSTVYTDISVYGAGLCMNNIYIYIYIYRSPCMHIPNIMVIMPMKLVCMTH